ncbi:unnamed protein product [Orchesella dallaii]|uniref:LsmAD domain-containing protein n=1 Tax=Orchesella dallaii TaxID=48710 RepID=A0ABP1RL50_9HEXA
MKSAHGLKAKGQRPHANKQIDGKGKADDPYFKYNMTILVGSSAEVRTRDGEVYEGIYVAFSSAMEILLEAAHLVTDNKDDDSIEKHFDVLVIPSEKVISMKCVNADLTYPTREFATDTAISTGRGGGMGSKELTPWECSEDTAEELSLDAGPAATVGAKNGWEAKDMFKKNEEKYGVVSTFNHDLSGYTTKVDKNDTEFKRLEEQANQIASEIERGTASWDRTQVENGDEEDQFSAVVRPRNNASSTSVNNNNNNNTSSVGNGKYIPPSRRVVPSQNNMEPSAPPPQQPHPPTNNNGPAHTNNNSSMNRKPIYNQNQNPRNNYGAPPNAVYHQDRRNFDSRRPPPQNQYGNPPNHGEFRRPEDSGPRPRMPNKVPSERKDPNMLKEFGKAFRLPPSDSSQMRRPPGNPPPPQVGMPPHAMAPNSVAPTRNPSPPTSAVPISSNKINKKEESVSAVASLPPLIPPNTSSESMNTPSDSSPSATTNSSAATTSASSAVSTIASPSTPVVANVSVSESTPTSTSSLASPPDNHTPSSASDQKAVEESKKKFAFNPNAKEFNPKAFTSRSPSTPPRPPSTPASAATPQIMAAQQIHSFMPIASMQPIFINQPYAQAALTPSSNSSTSSGVTTPRHGGHRKGGMVGLPPRSEMTPPIQMTAGAPILTPATAIQAPPQYYVSQGHYNVMRVVPQGIPVFQTESSGGSQMHPPVHFLPPNQANPQHNAGHQQNSTPPSNQSAPTYVSASTSQNVVPSNGHYGQAGGSHSGSHHMGYLPAGVPVPVVYGFGPPGPPIVQQVPFVPHQVSAIVNHKMQTQTLASDAMLQHKNWNILVTSQNNTLIAPRP